MNVYRILVHWSMLKQNSIRRKSICFVCLTNHKLLQYLLVICCSLFSYCFIDFIQFNAEKKTQSESVTKLTQVQPLKCRLDSNHIDWPESIEKPSYKDKRLTVVLLIARPEFPRLTLIVTALATHLDYRKLVQVMFLVPPKDLEILQPYFIGQNRLLWP